ncbi:hypothetical protein [Rhodoferax sp.]|uniref:hypothetical protein n=1 Tax=Rhodoferax sp. TaxID=50421 RepID=UPI00374DA8ED
MSPKPDSGKTPADLTLKQVAKKTKLVTQEIVSAEDELTVAHAVLDKHLPDNASEADVRQAVLATERVKKRLKKSVKELETVQASLDKSVAAKTDPAS